jgi:hypothetical protein
MRLLPCLVGKTIAAGMAIVFSYTAVIQARATLRQGSGSTVFFAQKQRASSVPSLTVLGGSAKLYRSGRTYQVGRGAILYEGDILEIPQKLTFCLDYCAGVVYARGWVNLLLVRRESGAIRTFISYSDYISMFSRGFINARSIVQFADLLGGGGFTYPPKNKRAFLLGTMPDDLSLRTDPVSLESVVIDNILYLRVDEGAAIAENVGKSVTVLSDEQTRIVGNNPPEQPLQIDMILGIEGLRVEYTALGLTFTGRINPHNSLRIAGDNVVLDQGAFKYSLRRRYSNGNQISIEVLDPFGKVRVYYRAVGR